MGKRLTNYAFCSALLGVVALALCPSLALAGGICRSRGVSYSYAAPVYSYAAKVVYPVETVALKAYKVPVSADYYSSVGDYYRDKVLVDAVAGRVVELSKLQAEIQSLRQTLQGQQLPPPQQQQPHYQPPRDSLPNGSLPQQMPPANGHGHYPKAPASPPQGGYGAVPERLPGILQQHCARCHGANYEKDGGGLDLRQPELIDAETRVLCLAACATGEMPKKAARLSDEELQVMSAWYNAARAQRSQARR